MAKQDVNIGTTANDGTGDPLRTAFDKINDNFDEIYLAGPVGTNVQISGNDITAINTNGGLALAADGTGAITIGGIQWPSADGTNGQVMVTDGAGTLTFTTLADAVGLSSLSEDTNPTLGGNLVADGNDIVMGTNLITDAKVGQWDTAFTWGDHSLAGYAPNGHTHVEADIVDLGAYLTDAPSDGTQYARKDGAWEAVAAGGGTPTELPSFQSINLYAENGSGIGGSNWYYEMITDDMVLMDYGHRGTRNDQAGGGYGYEPEFTMRKITSGGSSSIIGYLRIPEDGGTSPFVLDKLLSPVTDFAPGDRLQIDGPSGIDINNFDRITFGLRKIVLPRVPVGSLSVSWDAADYTDGDSFTLTITGDYTHVEYAISEISTDGGYNWYPADGGQSAAVASTSWELDLVSTLDTNQEFITTSATTGSFVGAGVPSNTKTKIRATVFGPAGYDTATAIWDRPGI